jgi:type III secretory pathway component EscS
MDVEDRFDLVLAVAFVACYPVLLVCSVIGILVGDWQSFFIRDEDA